MRFTIRGSIKDARVRIFPTALHDMNSFLSDASQHQITPKLGLVGRNSRWVPADPKGDCPAEGRRTDVVVPRNESRVCGQERSSELVSSWFAALFQICFITIFLWLGGLLAVCLAGGVEQRRFSLWPNGIIIDRRRERGGRDWMASRRRACQVRAPFQSPCATDDGSGMTELAKYRACRRSE
eukprot:scaffold3849_cov179-Amphora_coffeaeformis.AAC.29